MVQTTEIRDGFDPTVSSNYSIELTRRGLEKALLTSMVAGPDLNSQPGWFRLLNPDSNSLVCRENPLFFPFLTGNSGVRPAETGSLETACTTTSETVAGHYLRPRKPSINKPVAPAQ